LTLVSADYGGITLWRRSGRLQTIGSSHSSVDDVDRLQYDLREGPCVRAAERLEEISSPDVAGDPRWPRWGPLAAERGMLSAVSVDLSADNRRLGALNLYGGAIRRFGPEDVEAARYFAPFASTVLAAAITEDNLRTAVDARTITGQATGILMERFQLSSEQAIAVLRRYSQQTNIRLRDVAQELIRTRQLPKLAESAKELDGTT
jgi:GAF domain-containing protein